MDENKIKNNKKRIIIGILSSIIILLGSSYAVYRYLRTLSAIGITNREIKVTYTSGNNLLEFNNAYPISDEYAISNLDKMSYIDFSISGITNNPNIIYEIFLTENNGNTLDSKYIRVYLTDENGNEVVGPNTYSSLTNTSYRKERSNGKLVYKGSLVGNQTKRYRLYAWLNEDYNDNTISKNFSFYVNVFGYVENPSNSFSSKIATLVSNNVNYIGTYSGESNDTYDGVGNQTIYYYTGNSAKEHNNVLFAGYCWQVMRTTDTGGVKLLYNGVAENNQCLTTRNASDTMKGINGSGNRTIDGLNNTSTYGTGFTYDENGFTLTGVVTNKTWSTNNSELIGMYTCKGTATTCSTIYQIGRYMTNSTARGATYTIGTIEDKYTVGKTPFNGAWETPANVGYMYNKQYMWSEGAETSRTYANDVSYANGVYTLGGTQSGNNPDATHHYLCESNTDTTTCAKVRYYITYLNVYRYITLENGERIEDAIYNMVNYKSTQTNDANLNVYNSSMKAYLESWYAKNLIDYSSYIDNTTTYCNDRKVTSVANLGGWNKNGSLGDWLNFINVSGNRTDLKCSNTIDNFSVKNNKAKLTYPIGLITDPERQLMNGAAGDGVENKFVLGSSPRGFYSSNAYVRIVSASGVKDYSYVYGAFGARPVIALSSTASFSEGDGSYSSPYVVGNKVVRNIS